MSGFDNAMNMMANPHGLNTEEFYVEDKEIAMLACAYGWLEKVSEEQGLVEQAKHFSLMSKHYADCLALWIDVEAGDTTESVRNSILDLKYYDKSRQSPLEHKDMNALDYLYYISANAYGQVNGYFKHLEGYKLTEYCWKTINRILTELRG